MIKLLLMISMAQAYWVCDTKTEVGEFKYRGTSQYDATDKAVRACYDTYISAYIRREGKTPNTHRKILFVENCVNNTHCKEKK